MHSETIQSQIIFIGGYLNSGKGTYCNRHYKEYVRIGVSDIIRQIIGQSTRKELQATAHLDKQVAKRICEIIDANSSTKFIIDGIRQVSIFTSIIKHLDKKNIAFENIWLDVPIEECKRRFLAKNDGKENISFEEAFERDKNLGILDLERYWKAHRCTIIKNY